MSLGISTSLPMHLEKMRRTTDAWVVIPDQALAEHGDAIVRLAEDCWEICAQIVFDLFLVLRRRRNDFGEFHLAGVVNTVAMEDQPSRRFGHGASLAGPIIVANPWRLKWPVIAQDLQRF